MSRNYIHELPQGYTLKECVDRKKIPIWMPIAYDLGGSLTLMLLLLPLFIKIGWNVFDGAILIGLFFAFIYVLIYKATEGIVLRLKTGYKVDFDASWNGIFVSVHDAFVTRGAMLLSKLFPMIFLGITSVASVILCLAFWTDGMYIVTSCCVVIHIIMCIGGVRDIIVLRKYRREPVLISIVGGRFAIFLRSNDCSEDRTNIEEYIAWAKEAGASIERRSRILGKIFSNIGIPVLSVLATIQLILLFLCFFNLKYIELIDVFRQPSLYISLLSIGLLIYFICSYRKHLLIKIPVVIISIALIFPLIFAGGAVDNISCTSDIENYGNYDFNAGEEMSFFPEKITEDMTPKKYSYYYVSNLGSGYEIYLEIEMTEQAYNAERAKYEGELAVFEHEDGYLEYVISDVLSVKENSRDAQEPDIRKIIFNDETRTVIYEIMYATYSFPLENSEYARRFNINFDEYKVSE